MNPWNSQKIKVPLGTIKSQKDSQVTLIENKIEMSMVDGMKPNY